MGLIKSHNTPSTVSSFSLRDVESQARQIILRAQQKAEQLLAAAQEQAEQLAEQIKADARKQGVAEGRLQGSEEGIAAGKAAAIGEFSGKFESTIEAITQTITDFNTARSAFEAEAFTDVIQLAVSIARRVTQQQGRLQPAVLTENVRQAVQLVSQHDRVTVSIHPSQKVFLDEMLPQLKLSWPKVTHVELQTDESIQPGGCRVASGLCQIDAELDQQIDRIVADLLPAANESKA